MKTNQYNEPDVIFLQLHDPTDEGKTELADPKADGVTWCWEQIHHNDVEYIRKDLYDELKNQITTYQLTVANMESAQQIPEGYALEILRKVFDLYESAADCYDSDDHYSAAYIGKCIRLDDDLFKSCVDLLSASKGES